MVVARGTKHYTLFLTQIKFIKDVVNTAKFVDENDLWHKRLCQMSGKGIAMLAKNECVV